MSISKLTLKLYNELDRLGFRIRRVQNAIFTGSIAFHRLGTDGYVLFVEKFGRYDDDFYRYKLFFAGGLLDREERRGFYENELITEGELKRIGFLPARLKQLFERGVIKHLPARPEE
jgi:hypothetical protein